ncbi:MAG: DUF1127 domain-containing protein [Pseudorhodoplanes sp.]
MLTTALIAAARADINRHFFRNLQLGARRAIRRVRFAFRRLAEAYRDRRELEILLHADDRMLADIGLTRADVHFAFRDGRKAGGWSRATERDEASAARKAGLENLPQVNAPALTPAFPRQTIPHDNFR